MKVGERSKKGGIIAGIVTALLLAVLAGYAVLGKSWDLGLLCTHRPKSYFCIKDVD